MASAKEAAGRRPQPPVSAAPVEVDGTALFQVSRLHARISPDECSWALEDDCVVVYLEKARAARWAKLMEAPAAAKG